MLLRTFVRLLPSSMCLSLLVGVGMPTTQPAYAANEWPQWGGPGQDFKADCKGLAAEWPAEGPKKLWTRDLGEGYSGILVDGDALFTMYRGEDKERVVALSAKDGSVKWEHTYDSPVHKDHVTQFGSGPRGTPLLSDGMLYTVGVSGKMHCLDAASGKVVWSHDLWEEYKGSVLNHGYCSSPFAYKETVIVPVGGKDHAFMAFNKKDGSVVWNKNDFDNSYSTVKLINLDGKDQAICFMAKQIVGFDPNNGNLEWEFGQENQWGQNICLPVWTEGNLLFFSSPDAGSHCLKLSRDGDKTKFEEVSATKKIQFYHVTSVNDGNYVYGCSGAQAPYFYAAIDIKTGKVPWRERGFSKATTIMADGKLIILDEDGNLALATATPEKFTVHSKIQLLDRVAWTVPTLVGKTLFVRDQKKIMALDLG